MTMGKWVHKNAMDMFIEIIQIPYKGPEYYKIKYLCWNKGQCGVPHLIDTKVYKAKILKEDFKNWSRV